MNVYEKLMNIQSELVAPKGQFNSFGKYHYRSCEDIVEALKPLLAKHKAVLTITDEIALIGDRHYVKATAALIDVEKGEKVEVSAYAREDLNKKGMDLSQLTGSTSSYARKYALNGLFAIDDTKDSDATNTHDAKAEDKSKGNQRSYQQNNKNVDEDKQAIVDNSLATGKQLNLLYKLTKEKGFESQMGGYIKKTYSRNSSKELTKSEASEIINMLQAMK